MDVQRLHGTVLRLLEPKKGILAADESTNTCNMRFSAHGIAETEGMRRAWRELLITTPEIEKYVSGIILYDETIRQSTRDGELFTKYLEKKRILVGIKVDEGLVEMPGFPDENITQGLNGLPGRLAEYRELGATFAKWRAEFKISAGTPSDEVIHENAKILARYAKACQEESIVPIIEPEVLMDGAHSIEQTKATTEKVLKIVFETMPKYFVALEGLILKTSMVVSGKESQNRADAKTVARYTTEVLKNCVPAKVGGVVFLSGGQSPIEATDNLREIAKLEPLPWQVAFSFSRALQNDALKAWGGKDSNIKEAQDIFKKRLGENSLADQGL